MAKYTVVPITPQLLALVWIELWDRGLEEFRRIGWSLDHAFYAFMDYAQKMTAGGILLADDTPILVAGICPHEDGAFTFMQATGQFDNHKLAITRTMRRYIKAHVGPLHLYSPLVHPDAARFYKVLGMTLDDWQGTSPTGAAVYRFKRR